MKLYCKLGTQPYGVIDFKRLPYVGQKLWIRSNPYEPLSELIEVKVELINESCIFLSKV